MAKSTKQIKEALTSKTPRAEDRTKGMLSSGNTLLNMACSGKWWGAFMRGGFYLVIGDSTSGKTALAGTCFAEACINANFDDWELRFDNVENGALMFEKWFGADVAARVQPPPNGTSRTVEEFYSNIHRCTHSGKKGIYILDSEPALTSEQEKEKQAETRTAIEKDKMKEQSGVMTDGKAAIHSRNLRGACADIWDSEWIVIMITQTRDNMGFGAQFNPKTRPGGRALKFFAQLEMWSSVKGHIKKNAMGKMREIGIIAKVDVKKNRMTGKQRSVELPIYNSFGFDDLGACIDYLIEESHWKAVKGRITAPEFNDFEGTREELVQLIEETDQEKALKRLVAEVWNAIEDALTIPRKNRYA